MEILDLRHFSSLDLRPLLDDETHLWSRLLSWDYTSSAEMILRYVDAKILPGYAAVDRGLLRPAAILRRRRERFRRFLPSSSSAVRCMRTRTP